MDLELALKMTAEEAAEKLTELIERMKTDEYWLEYGGDSLKKDVGYQLLSAHYLKSDDQGKEANDILRSEFLKTAFANTSKPYIINRTTTNTVKAVLMSGAEYEVSLENVETLNHLTSSVVKAMKPKKVKAIRLIDGERVLESSNPRAILTDDSVLTIVVLA